jgi:hypothetical protein
MRSPASASLKVARRPVLELGARDVPLVLILRRLVLTFAQHPERDCDEQDQYHDQEQVSYIFPHTISLATDLPGTILP